MAVGDLASSVAEALARWVYDETDSVLLTALVGIGGYIITYYAESELDRRLGVN